MSDRTLRSQLVLGQPPQKEEGAQNREMSAASKWQGGMIAFHSGFRPSGVELTWQERM